MLRTIHLYDKAKELAGQATLDLDVDSPLALFNGLCSQIVGFDEYLASHKLAVVLQKGKDALQSVQSSALADPLGTATDVHLIPEIEGSGFEASAIIAALQAGAYITAVYYIAVNIAIAVLVGSVMQALAPSPNTSSGAAGADERPSFLYNGPVQVIEQGYAHPLVFGTHMTGSYVISGGVDVHDIAYEPEQIEAPGTGAGSVEVDPPVQPWQWGAGE
jgi:predicted phage tail protein